MKTNVLEWDYPILMVSSLIEAEAEQKEAIRQFTDLYDSHKGLLFSLALSIVGNSHDAEDILQTVFQKVWRDRKGWSRVRQWRPWLLCLTRNAALDHIKQASRKQKREETAWKEYFLESKHEVNPEWIEKLHLILRKLDEPSRTLILLKTAQELTFDEIGRALEIPASTASTRYYEAMKQLKNIWERME